MPIVRLVPSTYYSTSTTYLNVSNASNMYHNTDNTSYATIQNTRTSTTSYYIYLRGFNFDDVPSNAIINSFSVKLKGYESGGYNQNMYLYNGTSASVGSATALTTSVTTREFDCTASWEDLVEMGDNFGIRINCRRASRNTTSYFYIYGAEIEVDYTIPTPRTITTSLSGNGTITPSGTNTFYDGDEVELVITPTTKTDTVTATRDGSDITSQLVAHGAGSTITLTAETATTTGIQSGASYANYCIGYTAEEPYSSSNNMYASDTGYADYSFDFSSVPSNAVIEEIVAKAYGHRESATIDSTHKSSCELYMGSTAISEEVDFPSTSSTMITIEATTLPTRSQLDSVVLRHNVAYYGGLVLGISFTVTYSTGSGLDHYTYTFVVSADTSIAVVIGSSGEKAIYQREAGAYYKRRMYVKENDVWSIKTNYEDYLSEGDNIRIINIVS